MGFLLFVSFYIQSQSSNSINVSWYNIIYDETGNASEFIEAGIIKYDMPIAIRIRFNGFRENDFVKLNIIDDAGNNTFEEIREIRNNEILFELKLLTTEEYLMNIMRPYIKFRYVINVMNEYYFEGEYIEVFFAFRMQVFGHSAEDYNHGWILRSTDGDYEHKVHAHNDGFFTGFITYFMFPNLIPGRYYSLFWVNQSGQEFRRMEVTPFHELLNTSERQAE